MGEVAKGKALRRSGARPDDDIWVSGHLGDAALGLAHQQQRIVLEAGELDECLSALHSPTPRVALGQRLIGLAHSAIDISDGLLADLGHSLQNSNVAATIHMDEINCSASIKKRLPQPLAMKCLLAGGDDYELCFTAPRTARAKIEMLSREEGIQLTRIGRIGEGAGLVVLDAAGGAVKLQAKGYDHFHVEQSL